MARYQTEFQAGAEEKIDALAAEMVELGAGECTLALVLGSGLGAFADRLEGAAATPFEELAGMPGSAVPGHAGRLVIGDCEGVRVAVQQGRVHLYEGWSPFEVTRAVRAFARAGVPGLVLTNAAGGIRRDMGIPALMRITDHLNLQGATPLFPAEAGFGSPYDAALGEALDRAAAAVDVTLHAGVYAGLLGPTYESPSEIGMLERMGADAVGMSTVAEASAARASGMRVAAISGITNAAAGISAGPLNHEEVVDAGAELAESFERLLRRAVVELAAELASAD